MNFLFDQEVRIVIYSSKFAESRKFYENLLGLKVESEWNHAAGQLGVVYALSGIHLEILESADNAAEHAFYIYSKVDDVDTLFKELKDKAEIADTIATQPWKHRNFSIKDPNGYKIKSFSEVS